MVLTRREADFNAAFCLLRKDLPSLDQHLPLLHPAERLLYESLTIRRRKQSYLLGRIAAKTAVSTLLEITDPASFHIGSGVFDFPVVKGLSSNIQVSISHCDDIGIALAFPEEHPLGIDIEKIDEQRLEIMKAQLTIKETALLEDCGIASPAGFTLAWTIKEALSKVLKTGLTADFNVLEISSMERSGQAYTSTFRYFDQCKAVSIYSEGYACTIILPKKTATDLDAFFAAFSKLAS